jgi:phytoene/squalene synthetase
MRAALTNWNVTEHTLDEAPGTNRAPVKARALAARRIHDHGKPCNRPTRRCLERGWAALPASYRIPEVAPSLEEARAYCRRLAESHYENFHVASWFLPRALRPTSTRSTPTAASRTTWATRWAKPERRPWPCSTYGAASWTPATRAARAIPVFVALGETIRARSIPKEPFADLLTAFRQDQTVTRYASMQELLAYCRYSAATPWAAWCSTPAARRTRSGFRLSDATCTALQLANFWQDVRRDYAKGTDLPAAGRHAALRSGEETIAGGVATPEFRALLRHEVDFTRGLFEEGLALIGMVRRDLALDSSSSAGAAWRSCAPSSGRTTTCLRPADLSKGPSSGSRCAPWRQGAALLRLGGGPRGRRRDATGTQWTGRVDKAYAACRAIARSKAKNFYYAFVALPMPRRNAICAIYAFMRRADDLADDDSLPREERLRRLDEWLAEWRGVCQGGRPPTRSSSPCGTRRSGSRSRSASSTSWWPA